MLGIRKYVHLSGELFYCNCVNEYEESAAVTDVGQRYFAVLLN